MKVLYCEECEGRSEGPENVDSRSAPSDTEGDRATRESDSTGKRSEVETGQGSCRLVCGGELHMIRVTENSVWS